jgi:hypothetical protein
MGVNDLYIGVFGEGEHDGWAFSVTARSQDGGTRKPRGVLSCKVLLGLRGTVPG